MLEKNEKYCKCIKQTQQKVVVFKKQEIANYLLDEDNNRLPCGDVIEKESILYITSDRDTSGTDFKKVITVTGKEWYTVQTLNEWEYLLENACRITRSIVINLNHVSQVNETNTVFIKVQFGKTLVFDISENYRSDFTLTFNTICTLPVRNRKKRSE